MTLTARAPLSQLVDHAVRGAVHHRSVRFGPIPVRLSGPSADQLERFAGPLVASTGEPWPVLHIVVATSASLPAELLPEPIRPTGNPVVARDGGITALANGSDGTLWLFDHDHSRAVLWIDDFDALPLWEHSSPLRSAARWWSTVHGAAMVHAGVVADDDRAVLLVGDSGAGKSTTTMSCDGTGLAVLGDDFCFVEPRTGARPPLAHAMYRLAKLDDHALGLLPHLRPRVVGTGWNGKLLIDLGHDSATPRSIVAVCRVVQNPASPTTVTPISRADALRAVAPSTLFQQRMWERETFEALTATVRAVRCYELSVSDLSGVPSALRAVLGDSPTGAKQ